jgi:hypothetical protein
VLGVTLAAALSRRSTSLPVLKCGTVFSSTWTVSWVRGLRPMRAGRCFTVKAPNPRSSTRSPRTSAAVIWSNTVATMSSASSTRRGGLGGEFRDEFCPGHRRRPRGSFSRQSEQRGSRALFTGAANHAARTAWIGWRAAGAMREFDNGYGNCAADRAHKITIWQ